MAFIALILILEVLNGSVGHGLNAYGLEPRTTSGLIGIPLSPFLHGSYLHVQSNAVALLALGTLAVIRSGSRFPWICLVIILVGGLGVWLFGRPAIHVGASGLLFGLFGYLLVRGVIDLSILSIFVAVVVASVFGWMVVSGVVPTNDYVSWEGHLCGLIAGALAAIFVPGLSSATRSEGLRQLQS
jgi:membrane associated rhomboid family serine protease